APTLPNGYIVYSQVTIDVLNDVCLAEGFNADTPWNELTERQQNVVLYGSDKLKVPFGKHSLESRLRWTGIKAKPREEGYYKGMIPIMSDILRRDRNPNILKYTHSVTCEACGGTRLNSDALSVTVCGKSIAQVVAMELNELKTWIQSNTWQEVAQEITRKIVDQVDVLQDLGLGHLTLDRESKSLSSSEIQRIRVANQIGVPLSDLLYVFDEPSIGLHREENERMISHFKRLVERGNTVIVVEHDLDTISALKSAVKRREQPVKSSGKAIRLIGCGKRNLKNIDVAFQLGKLNVVSGRSGVGKSSLVKGTLVKAVQQKLGMEVHEPIELDRRENLDSIDKLIFIDHSPIGKTPRSNPATYLGISDHIRDLFSSLPQSKALGFTKSRFSFNNKGGRCDTCQGAGKIQIGMHFLGNVEMVCGTCNGDRFNEETLRVTYEGLSIADVYKLPIHKAVPFFEKEKKVVAGLKILQEIGLGYLTLGQSSTTLSGGEAQRIKIANQLQKKDTGDTLYVIIEPSIGLHRSDIESLLVLFDRVRQKGNTIVCIEQNENIVSWSDWHIELGPKSGKEGGRIVYQGVPVSDQTETRNKSGTKPSPEGIAQVRPEIHNAIELNGVTTHGLKNIDVRIPKNKLTAVTGLSGTGKSSLVYDTLFAEANARFTESLSAYNRSFLQQNSEAEIDSFNGLGPAIGINRKGGAPSKRSTVGTLSGVYDAFRLLYSRIAQQEGESFTAQHFSFNHHLGACPHCEGLGVKRKCNPDALITSPEKSIFEGALTANKALSYYADNNGQFMATLKEVAKQKNWNIELPWKELKSEMKEAILFGTGDREWDVTWEYSTKSRTGTHSLKAKWLGFCNYIDEEYQRKLHNKNIAHIEALA
ncbi:MAG: ATP-binding cassette domain-containing protein, partial [Flavobacteriales bacterium]|nr:ATP-binding cassette domain-containing protein [Flavobacteriales bacterium]